MRAVLLLGPPGSGKTTLARKMAAELPPMEGRTLVEASWIWWGSRLMDSTVAFKGVPFRAPHHTVSEAGLTGGGDKVVRPGEVSLAHGGCLLLDEITEFRRGVLETLAVALREGEACHVRSKSGTVRIPAKPALLMLASNVCPCGWYGTNRPCVCKPDQMARWNARLIEYCDLLGVTEIVPMEYRTVAEDLADGRLNAIREQLMRSA